MSVPEKEKKSVDFLQISLLGLAKAISPRQRQEPKCGVSTLSSSIISTSYCTCWLLARCTDLVTDTGNAFNNLRKASGV